jgi:hypothetical protein
MEFCPSPDHPVVQPDERGRELRKKLHVLYFGQMIVCLFKLMIFGSFAGIVQLMNLWIIYSAYATLHFCSIFLYLMMCFLEISFVMSDYRRATQPVNYPKTYED